MKILILTACPGGRTTSWLAAQRPARAAERCRVSAVFGAEPDTVDCIVVAASAPLNLVSCAGRPLYRVDLAEALADPDAVLVAAQTQATPYDFGADHAPGPAPAAARGMRIVAVTECPTGVAHTFMAAEVLATAARARPRNPGRDLGLGGCPGYPDRRRDRRRLCGAAGL